MFPTHDMSHLAMERMLRDRLEANIQYVDRQAARTDAVRKNALSRVLRFIPRLGSRLHE